jgi:hypothetical protein
LGQQGGNNITEFQVQLNLLMQQLADSNRHFQDFTQQVRLTNAQQEEAHQAQLRDVLAASCQDQEILQNEVEALQHQCHDGHNLLLDSVGSSDTSSGTSSAVSALASVLPSYVNRTWF